MEDEAMERRNGRSATKAAAEPPKSDRTQYPAGWVPETYDPGKQMMQLKGREYLQVGPRLQWFMVDQRQMIERGLATTSYVVEAAILEHELGVYARAHARVRDVLGNEATGEGSCTAKSFGDYLEKAETKATGRALAKLGYGTIASQEFDEGDDQVVDSPVARRSASGAETPRHTAETPQKRPATSQARLDPARNPAHKPATDGQLTALAKLAGALGHAVPEAPTYNDAGALITQWSHEYQAQRQAVAS
jgi:hypothetical protein